MIEQTRQREAEFALPAVYSALLMLVQHVLADRSQRLFAEIKMQTCAASVTESLQPAQATCRQCGAAIASAADLAVILDRLQATGLSCEHLTLCPECRG